MPDLRTGDVLAILCSDLHLSHTAPKSRKEKGADWYQVMLDYLLQLYGLSTEWGEVPVVVAGDIFDRWDAPAELINFAIENLPDAVYAVPGQHDLPNHVYRDIERSAYWTLVQAKKIIDLKPGKPTIRMDGDLVMYGFPWEHPILPHDPNNYGSSVKLAVVHSYIWNGNTTGYHGAPKEKMVSGYLKNLDGYDAAVFGDNHIGFHLKTASKSGPIHIFNSGGFIRRKSDEVDYNPQIGALLKDGSILPIPLKCDKDEFDLTHKEDDAEVVLDPELVQAVNKIGDRAEDFTSFLRRLMDNESVRRGVKEVVLSCLPGGSDADV